MKNTSALIKVLATIVIAAVVFVGTNAVAGAARAHYAEKVTVLTRAGNCQTDVLAPFIQKFKLSGERPASAADFDAFVEAQVGAGKVPAAAAEAVRKDILSADAGSPVFTQRGWVMSVIDQN